MKILHVCQLYYPSLGGNQIHIQLLSEKLVQLNNEVHVFTANALVPSQFTQEDHSFKPLPKEETINGVHVRRFDINYRLQHFLFKGLYKMRGGFRALHFFLGQSHDYWQTGPLVFKMLMSIRRLKPDLIVAVLNYSFTTYVCYLAKKLFGFKLIVMPIIHISDPRMSHSFLKKIYQSADGLIACTEFEKRYLVSQGVPEGKIEIHPLGIESGIFDGQDAANLKKRYHIGEAPIVAYIGRKVKHKGIESLIEAMPDVWRDFPQAKLLLAGQTRSDFLPILEKCLSKLKPDELGKVIHVEHFDETEKKDFFAAIDIFVMASEIDCFGIVYLEAWLSGKPVIACKNTAQETIIDDGVNGLLVEYGNPGDLVKALKVLLRDSSLRERMGQAGRVKVKEIYNLDTYARRIYEGYRRLVEGETR